MNPVDFNNEEKVELFGLKEIFISFLILFSFLVIWYLINEFNNSYERLKESTKKNSNLSSLQVHSQFEQIRNILFIMSSEIAEQVISDKKLSQYFTQNGNLISNIESFVFTALDGTIRATSLESSLSVNLSNFKDFIEESLISNDTLTYSAPLNSRITNEPNIAFNHRITTSKDKFLGVLSAIVPMHTWHSYFKKQLLDPMEEIVLIKLSDCSIIGSSTVVNGVFTSFHINKNFCEKYLHSSSLNDTFIEEISRDVISYTIFPEFKIALISYSPKEIILRPFFKKTAIIFCVSFFIIIGYWQLISYQIKTEKRLKEKKLQMINTSKLATLGEMASGIAHEINNPLAVVKGRLQQVLRYSKQPDEFSIQAIEKSATTALIAADRIQHIVASMKSISRNNSNDQFDNISLEQILNHTLIFCTEKIKMNNIELRVDDIPNVFIRCRESEISQVILNLISNASDALENLSERWIHIKFSLNNQTREISILCIDSGKGIPKEIVDKIMQPFYTTKPIGKGTGLGLSISAKILREHKGELVYLENRPNTTFKITLPYI